MKTGVEFIQRMQEDAEFRRKVNAWLNGEERLAFLKSEGYDFTPFHPNYWIICLPVSSLPAGWGSPAKVPAPGRALQVFWAASAKYSVPLKPPAETGSQAHGVRRGGPSGGASF